MLSGKGKLPVRDVDKSKPYPSDSLRDFRQRCMNILNLLRSCQFVNCFDGEDKLRELILKLDNIKLRFVIWLRLNREIVWKRYNGVMDILTRLDLFLQFEAEAISEGLAHGMVYHEEVGTVQDQCQLEDNASLISKCFQYHVDKYLSECQTRDILGSFQNTWIVINSNDCLDFLARIDTMIEDLFTDTRDDRRSALTHGYASAAVRDLSIRALQLVQSSGFSEANIICQAAQSRLRSQTAVHLPGGSSIVTFIENTKGKGLFLDPEGDTEMAYDPEIIFTPTTSEASLDVTERFDQIADRSKESQEIALTQDYPVNQLAKRRILAELRQADTAPSFASIACINNSIANLLGTISGPPDTPYEKGIFFIKIEIPEAYPLEPAKFKFLTKIHHPNINSAGQICVTFADKHWAIGCTIWGLLTSIYSLLADPNANSPLVPSIGADYKYNRKLFDATARDWTDRYANQNWPSDDELLSRIPDYKLRNGKASADEAEQDFWGRRVSS